MEGLCQEGWGLGGVLDVGLVVPVLSLPPVFLRTELMGCGHFVPGRRREHRQGGVWGPEGQEFR